MKGMPRLSFPRMARGISKRYFRADELNRAVDGGAAGEFASCCGVNLAVFRGGFGGRFGLIQKLRNSGNDDIIAV